MIFKGNHVKFDGFDLLAVNEEAKNMTFLFHSRYTKTIMILDSVFVISTITPTSTLIILDITKIESNNCL